jgi:hypothetical protein
MPEEVGLPEGPMGGKKESPAVDRALDILEAISERESGLSNSYLARRFRNSKKFGQFDSASLAGARVRVPLFG